MVFGEFYVLCAETVQSISYCFLDCLFIFVTKTSRHVKCYVKLKETMKGHLLSFLQRCPVIFKLVQSSVLRLWCPCSGQTRKRQKSLFIHDSSFDFLSKFGIFFSFIFEKVITYDTLSYEYGQYRVEVILITQSI